MNIGRENETVEFKTTTGEAKEGMKDIAAILNKHGGGTLYFGVKPNGDVCGQEIGDATLDDVVRICKEMIRPMIYPEIIQKDLDGKHCIIVRFSGSEPPYSADGRYFYRLLDRSEPMSPDLLRTMMIATDHSSRWENSPTPFGLEALDHDIVRLFYSKAISCGRLVAMNTYDEETLLTGLGLYDDGHLTNAGYYLFSSRHPVVLKMATYLTDERVAFSDIRRIEGNIYTLIPVALEYVKEHMNWKAVLGQDASRIEVPDVPIEAIREIVVNALAHADYRGVTEHEIGITPSRIEIYNPGSFPMNLTPESFAKEHRKSQPRNKAILNALFKSKEVEIFGSGFRKVYSLCEAAGIELRYEVSEEGFAFTFYRAECSNNNAQKTYAANLTKTDLQVLSALREKPNLTREELAAKLRIASRSIQRSLDKLVEAKAINRIGARKDGYWEILV